VRSFAKNKKNKKKKQQQGSSVRGDDSDDDEDVDDDDTSNDGKASSGAAAEEDIFGADYEKKLKGRMAEAAERLASQFAKMRGSAPSAELFDAARVDAYGSPQPLSAVAQVSVVSATLVECHCFDPDLAGAVAEALRNLDGLSLNPKVTDEAAGKLAIPFPKPSAEAREVVAKAAAKAAEKAKAKVRQVRQKARDTLKKVAKADNVAEEDVKRRNAWIDTLAEATQKQLTTLLDKKKADILASSN